MAFPLSRKLVLFLALNLLDLVLTWVLALPGSETFRELNPVADWWLRSGGWAGLAAFKLATALLAAGLLLVVARSRPQTGAWGLNVGCLAVGAVVLYSSYLLASNAALLADIYRLERQRSQQGWAFPPPHADLRVGRPGPAAYPGGGSDPLATVDGRPRPVVGATLAP